MSPPSLLTRLMPLLFVLLWSTGFIGAKYGLPYAEPLTFLVARYVLVIGVMGLLALATRAPWPHAPRQWLHIGVTGLLVHATYLGGVFMAISHGLPAGIASLVVGLQPLLTALGAGALLGEKVLPRQWAGLVLGFGGVGLVVSHKVAAAASAGMSMWMSASPSTPSTFALLPTTSATPPKPSASPVHCRADTRSPSSTPASAAVSSGCMPTTNAETPAGRPRWMDMNTPPR